MNLVEKSGREKIIGDAYLDNALALNRPDLNFVYFDFHEYCRGMKFENVNVLIQALESDDYIKSMRYCWLDRHGVVCQQQVSARFCFTKFMSNQPFFNLIAGRF